MLVMAKHSPPPMASQSAPLLGSGQGESGALSTITTPPRASSSRSSEARLGRSPSSGHASTMDQAGMR
jgi:hypothetical protein